jgi:hypothetical protein
MKISIFPQFGSLNSKPVFDALIRHLKEKNENIYINEDRDCDVAIIWSVLWSGRMAKNLSIWEKFRSNNKPVVVLEVGGLKRNLTWKIGINGINRDADFANQEFDSNRWPLFNLEMQPWRKNGEHIIICGQHDNSQQRAGKPLMSTWIVQQIKEIRKYTDREIIVRPHPRNLFQIDCKQFKNVKLIVPKYDKKTYDDTDYKKILKDAWAVVNYSSNPGIESVLNGKPVFVSESSLCYEVGNNDLSKIENPVMPDRQNWANKLSYTEWTTQEIGEGLPWQRIRRRLEEKYIKS